MSDLVVTASSVAAYAGAQTDATRSAGATITQGQTVYLDATTNTYKLFDANLSAAAAVLAGVALVGASAGQPIVVVTAGPYNPGATVTVGGVYVGSATAGGVAPVADLTSNWYTNILGVALTSTKIQIQIQASGVQVP